MKNRIARCVGLAALMLAAFCTLPGCNCVGDVVFIPDAALDSALRAALGKPFGCLTRQDLQSIVELQAAGLNIRNLQGLENCTSLTVLNLRSNRIQSISPLSNLINLTNLDLGDNRVTNIEPLAGLVFLRELNLFGDAMEIYNWSPLVANAVAGGGLGAGDVVILPTATTLNADNTVKEYWLSDYNALVGAGVTVLFADGGGSVFGL